MKVALIQMSSGDDPLANLATVRAAMTQARAAGADLALTPEMTNIMTANRNHLRGCVQVQDSDPVLSGLRDHAAACGMWLGIGSLAVRTGDPDGRLANRSLLIDANGGVVATYDKIHMFDVDLTATETYRESAAFRPGTRAVLADTPWGRIGLTICYDLRFPVLHRSLAQAGADIILQPAAFTVPTGQAHWHVLLRARAIETGCFILAAAQTGTHPRTVAGLDRHTFGHSLAIDPWGSVLADAGTAPGITLVDLDLTAVAAARRKIPALSHTRTFAGP